MAHTLLIALSNFKTFKPNKTFMPLKKFQAEVTASLVTVAKRKTGKPSLDTIPSKKVAVQGTPTIDTRFDLPLHS